MTSTKMTCILSAMLCLALLAACIPVCAETNVTRIRTKELGVSFRSTPEKPDDNSNKICGIHADTELAVFDLVRGWYLVEYRGQMGYVSSDSSLVTVIETRDRYRQTSGPAPTRKEGNSAPSRPSTPDDGRQPHRSDTENPRNMGVPCIGSQVYYQGQQNMVVFWIQTQMKATGIWYQGEIWDVTGNLGDHTMSEIARFMRSRGYNGHRGIVDQDVIDELAAYLGYRVEPVYIGGFYNYMNCIMTNGSCGSMNTIRSNLTDMVPRVTTGAHWVQVILKHLGYYSGPTDGKYGEATERAVMQFQRQNGFEERNYVSLGVARCMLEQYYCSGYNLYELP